MPSRVRFIAAVSVVLFGDQLTKWLVTSYVQSDEVTLVPGILRLYVTRNTGGIFGVMQGSGLIFFILTSVVMAVLIVWALRTGVHPQVTGAIAGGGLGNLADRIFRAPSGRVFEGGVIDFIDLSFWPSFNLADSAISIGVLVLIVHSFLEDRYPAETELETDTQQGT